MLWRQPQIFEGSSLYFCSVFQLQLSIFSILSLNHSFHRPLPSAIVLILNNLGSPSLDAYPHPHPFIEPFIRFPKCKGVPQRSPSCPRCKEILPIRRAMHMQRPSAFSQSSMRRWAFLLSYTMCAIMPNKRNTPDINSLDFYCVELPFLLARSNKSGDTQLEWAWKKSSFVQLLKRTLC